MTNVLLGFLLLLPLLINGRLNGGATEEAGTEPPPENYVAVRRQIQCGIGLGTAGLQHATKDVVLKSLELGVTLIDSAQAQEWYNEHGVGDALQAYSQAKNTSTGNVVVVTKIHPRDYELSKMRQALLKSKSDLQRSSLDVVLLHFPRCQPGQCPEGEPKVSWQHAWKNLETLKNELYISEIGVSNFEEHELLELVTSVANARVSVVQNWMDPFHQDRKVRAFAIHHRMDYMAYSSYGTQWNRKFDHNVVFNNPLLHRIADKHKSTVTQVVLSWLHIMGVVSLPRSSKEEHLKENFQALRPKPPQNGIPQSACEFYHLRLDKEDMEQINELDGILGNPWEPLEKSEDKEKEKENQNLKVNRNQRENKNKK